MSEGILKDVKDEISSSKKTKVAINGFGRIGRMVLRAGFEDDEIEFVAINDPSGAENAKYLLKHDSAHGMFPYNIDVEGDNLVIGNKKIKVLTEKEVDNLPWSELNIDIVAECSGLFTHSEDARKHLDQGAKKILISAPGKGEDCFYMVRGVNEEEYEGEEIVSNGSCTTNSMTSIINKIHQDFGIENAMFSTVHSVTGDQRILDASHPKDRRRGRAAAFNIIPTTTGAGKSVTRVIPELEGKIHGIAYRVPTITGSVTDLNIQLKTNTSTEEIKKYLKELSKKNLNGIVEYSEDELVSSDIIGNPHSAIVDGLSTTVIDNKNLKLVLWYDNEWGFSNRMVEVMKLMSKE